jgi:hypothetical protein
MDRSKTIKGIVIRSSVSEQYKPAKCDSNRVSHYAYIFTCVTSFLCLLAVPLLYIYSCLKRQKRAKKCTLKLAVINLDVPC